MNWPYYYFRAGRLYDEEQGEINILDAIPEFNGKTFASSEEAQAWLEDNDIRGTIV